jgi:hypothetical protein
MFQFPKNPEGRAIHWKILTPEQGDGIDQKHLGRKIGGKRRRERGRHIKK